MKTNRFVYLVLALCVIGCGRVNREAQDNELPAESVVSGIPGSEAVGSMEQGDTESISEKQQDSESTAQKEEGKVILNNCCSFLLPGEWQDKTKLAIRELENGGYVCTVTEVTSENAGPGGLLFAMEILPETEDYTTYPDYRYLGRLVNGAEIRNVVVSEPTDVQYTEETEAKYKELSKQRQLVYDSFEAEGNWQFEKNCETE